MKILDLLPCLKSATIIFLISLCLAYPGYAAAEEYVNVTLQWNDSIDYPYLKSYKVYYYPTSGDKNSPNSSDATSCTVDVDTCSQVKSPITIVKGNTKITLNVRKDKLLDYYFAVSAVDDRDLEGETTDEIIVMKGDINGDGAVNLKDAILVFKLMSRVPSTGLGTIVRFADVHTDGKLGVEDAIYILQKVASLRSL
jgi:hypothetical protein